MTTKSTKRENLFIPFEKYIAIQKILRRNTPVPDAEPDEVLAVYTVKFDKEYEADIKICNGDSPYVDAVLFKNGDEVCVCEPTDIFLGECWFETNHNVYIVDVQVAPKIRAAPKKG